MQAVAERSWCDLRLSYTRYLLEGALPVGTAGIDSTAARLEESNIDKPDRARRWLLYGATGYTGRLIAHEARRLGLRPILAGRDATALGALGSATGLPTCTARLDDPGALDAALSDVALVLHCAGPFSATSAPMREACLRARAHYLDITGEIDVFIAAQAEHDRAVQAGVLLCPGVGFDVVPTDCVAASLHEALPDATHLALGFAGLDALSAGTAATSLEAIARGMSRVREAGAIVDVPFGARSRLADFGRGPEPSFVIPWGDVATAYFSTGIPNIEVHVPARSRSARSIRAMQPLARVLSGAMLRHGLHRLLRVVAAGPSERQRGRQAAFVWGEVRNPAGELRRAELRTGDGYALTIQTALMAVRHVLDARPVAGYRTPSQLMGARCIERVTGARSIVLTG